MNKVLLLSFVGLSVGLLSADDSLGRISKAIKDKDLARVKTLWRKIDRHASTIEEKREKLNTLIDEASGVADNEVEPSSSSFSPYAKMGSGITLLALGAIGWGISDHYRSCGYINDKQYIGGIAGSFIMITCGSFLFDSGKKDFQNSGTNQEKKGELIARYFEERLDELDEPDED